MKCAWDGKIIRIRKAVMRFKEVDARRSPRPVVESDAMALIRALRKLGHV